MATLTYTYSFTNGTAANAVEVNSNFNAASAFVNTELVNRDGSVAMTGGLTLPGDPSSPSQAARKQYVDNAVAAALPVATIIPWAGTVSIPAGYLLCDGTSYVQATYPNLYAAILLTYSVAPHQTVVAGSFRVPDLRGRTIHGLDNMGGTDAGRLSSLNTLGTPGGAETHTLSVPEIPLHSHNHNDYYKSNSPLSLTAGFGYIGMDYNSGYADVTRTSANQNGGGGGAHNNMSPNMVLSYLIKT